jgi:hypothetical protein
MGRPILARRRGVDSREVVAFIIGILLAFTAKEAAVAWQAGATIGRLNCRVNRIFAATTTR